MHLLLDRLSSGLIFNSFTNSLGGGGRRGGGHSFNDISKGRTISPHWLSVLILLAPWTGSLLLEARGCWRPRPKGSGLKGLPRPPERRHAFAFLGTRVPLTQEVGLQPYYCRHKGQGDVGNMEECHEAASGHWRPQALGRPHRGGRPTLALR